MSMLSCSLRFYLAQRQFTEPGSVGRRAAEDQARRIAMLLISKGC